MLERIALKLRVSEEIVSKPATEIGSRDRINNVRRWRQEKNRK